MCVRVCVFVCVCVCVGGGFGGQKFKNLENLPNGWTNWHQIWHIFADSSGNGHRLKTIRVIQRQ